jgi:hypothetical protein
MVRVDKDVAPETWEERTKGAACRALGNERKTRVCKRAPNTLAQEKASTNGAERKQPYESEMPS